MKRVGLLLAVSLVAMSCATMQPRPQDLVSHAVEALGGADKMSAVKTLWVKATVRQWEPEQSMVAGGEMRFACESTVEVVLDVGARAGRADWVRKFAYPAPRTYTFTEIVTPDAGYVAGIDALLRTRQSLESNPPAHAMSGLRLATAHREMRRSFLLGEMLKNPDRVSSARDVTVGGVSYPAVEYRAPDQTFIVMFDRATGLPARVRTLDYDYVWGDVTYDLVLSDWLTTPDGRRAATTNKYELNGRTIMEVKITDGKVNVPVPADRLTIPDAFKAVAPKPAAGPVPYQWVIRRQFIGTYLDSDVPSYDTRATSGLRLVELAPGVQQVVGGTHHSLLVEMRDHLIVFDAPVNDWHSTWVLHYFPWSSRMKGTPPLPI